MTESEGHSHLDYLVDRIGMSRRPGESDELLRKRAALRRDSNTGSPAGILRACDAYGDPDARLIEGPDGVIVSVDVGDALDELRHELQQRAPMVIQIVVTDEIVVWLAEARIEGARHERRLNRRRIAVAASAVSLFCVVLLSLYAGYYGLSL